MKAQTILLLLGTAIASVVPQGAEQLSKVENVFEKKSCVGLNRMCISALAQNPHIHCQRDFTIRANYPLRLLSRYMQERGVLFTIHLSSGRAFEELFRNSMCVVGEKDQTICMLGGGEKQHRPEVLAEKGRRNNSIQTG
ncbi:hypothetical protein E6O75_ATG08787 [Venturia nashicola]|uniref:Uncharacterized protein n=1 Tax=Venturia nashicola TaxID=86259 RepID=A0A4Z1NV66_9PEZI|nr:hypothetical protein E6O75_ATG08787 [Venturia nashicola]